MNMAVLWNIVLCSLLDTDIHFRGTYFTHRQTRLHCAVSQKTAIFTGNSFSDLAVGVWVCTNCSFIYNFYMIVVKHVISFIL